MTLEIDVNSMSLDDLRNLRTQIDRAISSYETRRRKEALAALERTARDMGFNLADLTGAQQARGRRAAAGGESPAKYAHPEDPSQTWSGRGRRPRWVTEQLESGKSLEDLRV